MSVGINRYKCDLRELQFVLLEQFSYAGLAGKAPYENWGEDELKAVLSETYRFAREVLGPLNSVGDREGVKMVNGAAVTPKGFREAWKGLYEGGFKQLAVPSKFGGQAAPEMLHVAVEEILSGANIAFNIYPGLAWGVGELLAECGTPAQIDAYVEKVFNGKWGGTMCLTEPHAGSDVGAVKTRAVKQADGRYKIQGTKIFISGGDHDMTENIIHLVLARVEGAPAGTKGISLFIVPKLKVNADGSSGESNDVALAAIEHKMGLNGSATCTLSFGENNNCYGELVGTAENIGMSQMFRMMNGARIAVGLQGLSLASSAYLNALEYARDRKQGPHFSKFKDPNAPRVAIIEHPDVRRMLLELKSTTEGIRALVVKLAMHRDYAIATKGKDDEKAAYHQGQVDLLTPLVKSYAGDEAYRLCGQAIQVYGGAGYLKDWPVEQYARDAKIFSIYEGTSHIQAMDLVGRKLGQHGGANFQAFMNDINVFVEAQRAHPAFGKEAEMLGRAAEAVTQLAMAMLGWSQAEKMDLLVLNANRFLTMMSQLSVGWLLLDAGVKAQAASIRLTKGNQESSFYEGKVASALWYARNVVAGIRAQADMAALEDDSAEKISDAAFGGS
ncbi:MAG: acyl-CoA dehydrogenase [Myxococcaceae bacterium]|nr:acyl-CoA dehydrogenase [Myxococcaceae bacterium]